jgi:hypothetical protein
MFAATTSTDGECRGYDNVKKKLLVSLGLFTLIASSVSLGAYAGANLEEVKAYLNKGIQVQLNGQPLQIKDSAGQNTYPLSYKGTTWLPVRAIGDALSVGIGWDEKANAIDIKSNSIPTITTAYDIKSYLISNYSIFKTSIGYTSFKFDIYENSSIEYPYDYAVNIDYDEAFFNDLQTSENLTADQKIIVKNELRIFSEKIGRSLIERVPNKKIQGGYFKSWYEDPAKTKLIYKSYYSWSNYDELPYGSTKPYSSIKPTTFRWYDLIDSEL